MLDPYRVLTSCQVNRSGDPSTDQSLSVCVCEVTQEEGINAGGAHDCVFVLSSGQFVKSFHHIRNLIVSDNIDFHLIDFSMSYGVDLISLGCKMSLLVD